MPACLPAFQFFMKSNSRLFVPFIIITVLLDTAGVGLILPVLPKLLAGMIHADISDAARYGGWLAFVYALMQFVFAPVFGNLSDAWGRRPVLLFALAGMSIDYAFLAFAPSFAWLFIGRLVSGITGATYPVASAYMADVSDGDERTKNFGLLSAGMGAGFILGPALGGWLGQYGLHIPFMAAAVLSMLNLLLGYFALPESLAVANRRSFSWKKSNPLSAIGYLKSSPNVTALIVAVLLLSFASHSMETVWTYFTAVKFNWSSGTTGLSLAVMGILFILVQAVLIERILKLFSETQAAIIGLALTVVTYLIFALSPWSWSLFIGFAVYAVGTIGETAMQGLLSNQIPANQQGELQGSLGSLKGLITIAATLFFAQTFAAFSDKTTSHYFPGIPFLLAGFFVLLSLIVVLIRRK